MKLAVFASILIFFTSTFRSETAFSQILCIETDKGNIELKLHPDKAPITCANFLNYVDNKRYDGSVFYRVVRQDNQPDKKIKIDVIQGGLYNDQAKMLAPIAHETTHVTGLKHLNGTVSMARNEPGSASSEFFICINDQPELDFKGKRQPDGQGFSAFGEVVSGMDIVLKIQKRETSDENPQILKEPVKIKSITRKN